MGRTGPFWGKRTENVEKDTEEKQLGVLKLKCHPEAVLWVSLADKSTEPGRDGDITTDPSTVGYSANWMLRDA